MKQRQQHQDCLLVDTFFDRNVPEDEFVFTRAISTLRSLTWEFLPFHPICNLIETSVVLKSLTIGGYTLNDPRCFVSIASSPSVVVVNLWRDMEENFKEFKPNAVLPLFGSSSIRSLALEGFRNFLCEGEWSIEEQSILRKLTLSNGDSVDNYVLLQRIVRKLVRLKTVNISRIFPKFGVKDVEAAEAVVRPSVLSEISYCFDLTTPDFSTANQKWLKKIGREIPYQIVLEVLEFVEVGYQLDVEDLCPVSSYIDFFGRFMFDVTRQVFLIFSSVAVKSFRLSHVPKSIRHLRNYVTTSWYSKGPAFRSPTRGDFLVSVEEFEMTSFDWFPRAPRLDRLKFTVDTLRSDHCVALSRPTLRVLSIRTTSTSDPTDARGADGSTGRGKLDCRAMKNLSLFAKARRRFCSEGLTLICPNLTSLYLDHVIIDESLQLLEEPHLLSLSLVNCSCVKTHLPRFLDLESLRKLVIEGQDVDLDGAIASDRFVLEKVQLRHCPLAAFLAFLPLLQECPLRVFDLTNCEMIGDHSALVQAFYENKWARDIHVRLDRSRGVTLEMVQELQIAKPAARIFWDKARDYSVRGGFDRRPAFHVPHNRGGSYYGARSPHNPLYLHSCFGTGQTVMLGLGGQSKRIEDVVVGDKVVARSLIGKKLCLTEVIYVDHLLLGDSDPDSETQQEAQMQTLRQLTIKSCECDETGQIHQLVATTNHLIPVQRRGTIQVGRVNVGDRVFVFESGQFRSGYVVSSSSSSANLLSKMVCIYTLSETLCVGGVLASCFDGSSLWKQRLWNLDMKFAYLFFPKWVASRAYVKLQRWLDKIL